ncbi:MAG: hypothetical protein Fur0037_02340 [Planctomycetota bacterium]
MSERLGFPWLGRAKLTEALRARVAGGHGALALAGVLLLGGVRAQGALLVDLVDGKSLAALGVSSKDGRRFSIAAAGSGERIVEARDLLSIHLGRVTPSELPAIDLGGGDRLRGRITGGDPNGQWLEIASQSLGRMRVLVDRIAAVRYRPSCPASRLRLPAGVDEALFRKAGIGLDLLSGTIHQFGARGVRFRPADSKDALWFPAEDLVGVRIADPLSREAEPGVEISTRGGDRLGVELRSWVDGTLDLLLENGERRALRESDLACVLWSTSKVAHLSALEPVSVSESGYDGPVVHPFRKDEGVLGGPLDGGGLAHARGLGVHSRSRLDFTVPPGARFFWTRVALDDSVRGLPLRPGARVEIRVDDETRLDRELTVEGGAVDSGRLPVEPGGRLSLIVDFGRGRDLGDRVVWLTPVFLLEPGT